MATKSLFDHLNHIYIKQSKDYWESLTDSDRKSWSDWMINRFISMVPDYLPVVNEIQQYYAQVKGKELYLFYSQLLPKKKMFAKYIKGTQDEAYPDWVVARVSAKYLVSYDEAERYLDIFYDSATGRAALRELLEGFGTGPADLKKAGL